MGLFGNPKTEFTINGKVSDNWMNAPINIGEYIRIWMKPDGTEVRGYLARTVGGAGEVILSGSRYKSILKCMQKGGEVDAKIIKANGDQLLLQCKLLSAEEVIQFYADMEAKRIEKTILDLNKRYTPKKPFEVKFSGKYQIDSKVQKGMIFTFGFENRDFYLKTPNWTKVSAIDPSGEHILSEIAGEAQSIFNHGVD